MCLIRFPEQGHFNVRINLKESEIINGQPINWNL